MLQAEPLPVIDITTCDLHITKLANMLQWLTSYPGLVKSMSIQLSQESTSLGCEDRATYAAVAERLLVFALEKATLLSQPPLRLQSFSTNLLHTPAVLTALAGAGVNGLALTGLPVRSCVLEQPTPHHHTLGPAFAAALATMTTLRALTLTADSSERTVEFNVPYAYALNKLPALNNLQFAAATLPTATINHLPRSLKQLTVAFGTTDVVDLSHLTTLQDLTLTAVTELAKGSAPPPHLTFLHLQAGSGRIGHLDWTVLSTLRELWMCAACDVADLLTLSCGLLTELVCMRLIDVPVSPSSATLLAPIWQQMPKLLSVVVRFAGGAQGLDLAEILKGIGTATTLRSLFIDNLGLSVQAAMSAPSIDVCKHFTALKNLTSLEFIKIGRMKMYDPLHLTVLTRLRRLSIVAASGAVDSTVMTAIGCTLSGLSELNIICCCGVTGMSFLPAIAKLRNLGHLQFCGNRRSYCTDAGLMMMSALTNLTLLVVDGDEITEEGQRLFQAALPKVVVTCRRKPQ